ncbi:hypothetical protein Q4S45_00415 [Massilia sp. R2A-15]|uniref:hypothetical protein n=1 Tax=Massilia sp. R2A-15 TaxID=3064278 RepID=UPI002732EE37|nr:hypothetical protein [Massilia sp. R2A-15]WLI89631.1 hypothetical protein Q4S45_00415 [Massilia sp. R2A-15]
MIDAPASPDIPEADVPHVVQADRFYIVAKRKFTILFLATMGLYSIYWMYKQWSCYKVSSPPDAKERKFWPVARAIFGIFFFHSLFRRVRAHAGGSLDEWENGAHATFMVILILIASVLDKLARKSIGSPVTDYLSMAMIFPLWFFYFKAQCLINESCGDPEGTRNSRLTGANYAWIALGVVLWISAAVGIARPA